MPSDIIEVNGSQGNAAFDALVKAEQEVSQDILTKGVADEPLDLPNSQKRSAQNLVTRTPWIMTTTEWLTEPQPRALVWAANPKDISWQMTQRSFHSKNLFGTVLHVWPDPYRGTFYDEYRLTINFQSGNLMPVFLRSEDSFVVSDGIANFYDFMQLVDAPKLTTGDKNNPPRANLVHILYNSNLFPKITLMGMFDSQGISFTDSADDPNNVASWSAQFVVYDSIPKLSNFESGQKTNASLLSIWKENRIDNNPTLNSNRQKPALEALDRGIRNAENIA
jgi:hypothetical protein